MDHLFDLFSQCFKGVICFTRFGPCYLGSALNPPICWHRLRALLGLWVWPWMIALTSVCASASPCGLLSTRAVKQVSWVVKTITQNLNIIGVIFVFSLLWLYLYWWLLIEIYDCILNAFFFILDHLQRRKSQNCKDFPRTSFPSYLMSTISNRNLERRRLLEWLSWTQSESTWALQNRR